MILLVSFLTGAAAAQQWTLATTLALICALAGFQAEHPFVLKIKQQRSWKPRFLLWGSLYVGLSLGIAAYLYLQTPLLLWLYLGAIAAEELLRAVTKTLGRWRFGRAADYAESVYLVTHIGGVG